MTQTIRYNRSHVLLTLGALFLIAGATRLLPNGRAQAEGPDAPKALAAIETEAAATTAIVHPIEPNKPTTEAPQTCLSDDAALSGAIDWAAFEAREAGYVQKSLELQSWEATLEAQTRELEGLQMTLDKRWEDLQTVAGDDARHLAQMYAVMKPDQAAAIFNEMDPKFSAGLLRELQGEQAGMILANMDSSKAYIITVTLAGRSADIRTATNSLDSTENAEE